MIFAVFVAVVGTEDKAVAAHDFLVLRIPDNKLLISIPADIVVVHIGFLAGAAPACAERHFPQPSDFHHRVGALVAVDDINFVF